MSSYNPNIPQPTDFLSDSQSAILNNFTQANTSFGIDHYSFADGTANNGKHNKVTTPLISGSAHPATAANEPIFYAMQDNANLGVLQYSRGGNNAKPTPVTFVQSPVAATILNTTSTIPILDFTGLTDAIFNFYVANLGGTNPMLAQYYCFYRSTPVFRIGEIFNDSGTVGNPIALTSTGSVLQLVNLSGSKTYSNIYWSIQFLRIT